MHTFDPPVPWTVKPVPGIAQAIIDHATLCAIKSALRAVDLDIERTGAVSAETVDKVRIVRAQLAESAT